MNNESNLREALNIAAIRKLEDDVQHYSGNEASSGRDEVLRRKAEAWERAVAALQALASPPAEDVVERSITGETIRGFRVAAWRETHPEHGDTYGYKYSEHWSPNTRDPRVRVERLFTESQLRAALATQSDSEEAVRGDDA